MGSSRISSRGSSASTEARHTRWSSPPESCATGRWASRAAPTDASAAATRPAISSGGVPTFSRPNATSDSTRVNTTWSSGSWKSVATVPASSEGRVSRVSRPAISTRPEKRPPWKCGTSPASARNNVDFPEPDGPSSTTTSPGCSSNETPESAGPPLG